MTVVQCQMRTFWVISWWEQLKDDDVFIVLEQLKDDDVCIVLQQLKDDDVFIVKSVFRCY
jgi:hypothetical protein